jgi:hypothetical protein
MLLMLGAGDITEVAARLADRVALAVEHCASVRG